MVSSINKFIEMNPKLSKEERNILSAGYKNIISDKRASWRLLNSMERKEAKKKSSQVENIKEIKSHIEKELKSIFEDIHNLLDKYLLPNAEDPESKVFYLRLKGDHYRYLCEITKNKEFDSNIEKAEKLYREAYQIAIKDLPVINNISESSLSYVLKKSNSFSLTDELPKEPITIIINFLFLEKPKSSLLYGLLSNAL